MSGVSESEVVFTDKWTGELKGNQVLMPSKFRVNDKLVNLIEDGYAKKVGEVGKEKWIIDTDKTSQEGSEFDGQYQ